MKLVRSTTRIWKSWKIIFRYCNKKRRRWIYHWISRSSRNCDVDSLRTQTRYQSNSHCSVTHHSRSKLGTSHYHGACSLYHNHSPTRQAHNTLESRSKSKIKSYSIYDFTHGRWYLRMSNMYAVYWYAYTTLYSTIKTQLSSAINLPQISI